MTWGWVPFQSEFWNLAIHAHSASEDLHGFCWCPRMQHVNPRVAVTGRGGRRPLWLASHLPLSAHARFARRCKNDCSRYPSWSIPCDATLRGTSGCTPSTLRSSRRKLQGFHAHNRCLQCDGTTRYWIQWIVPSSKAVGTICGCLHVSSPAEP